MSGFQSKEPRDREQQPPPGSIKSPLKTLGVSTHILPWTTMVGPERLEAGRTIGKPRVSVANIRRGGKWREFMDIVQAVVEELEEM